MPTHRSILLVEDDDDIRELMRVVLESEGYEVSEARHGGEAIDLLARGAVSPDLAIVDLMMPMMDGRQLAQAMTRERAASGIPLIVVSGDPRACEHAEDMRARACLPKPFELDEMLSIVARTLERPQA